ncbi:MAG: sensor histidine kinase [Oliverpabstia sp.]
MKNQKRTQRDVKTPRRQKNYSIKSKVFIALLIFQIPLVLLVILYTMYFVQFYNDRVSASNENALNVYCSDMEETLKRLDENMTDFVAFDYDFRTLAMTTEPLDAHLLTLSIMNEYNSLMVGNDALFGCYIISEKNHLFREVYSMDGMTYKRKDDLRDYFSNYIEGRKNIIEQEWTPLWIDDKSFLYLIKGFSGTYSIYIIDVGMFDLPETSHNKMSGQVVLFHDEMSLNMPEELVQNHVELHKSEEYYFSGDKQKYMITEKKVKYSSVEAAYVMKYDGFFSSLSVIQKMLILATMAIIVALVPIGYYLLKRIFFRPVDQLVDTMNEIKKGNLETRADNQFADVEFKEVNQTFNSMISQINQLKIESYEKELSLRETQLEYFQLQIRPHFYINCLKSIYGLLEEHKEEEAGKSIIYLSRHLRYMFKEVVTNTSIEEELQYVRNYIELQEINMAYPPECKIEVGEDTKTFMIPAISILSFVENSVKYGKPQTGNLRIGIFIDYMDSEDGRYLNIHISDNGQGFTDDMIQKLNSNDKDIKLKETVGITNVIQRFQLCYGEENVLFAFSNTNGANIDIFIKEESKSEYSDG